MGRELEQLIEKMDPGIWIKDPEEMRAYGKDWTSFRESRPGAVALPRSTEEVSKILRACSELGIRVVPSGGRTGLAGGAVAPEGELVLNLSRMKHMQAVNTLTQTVRVQAGAVNQAVQEHCADHGLVWPVELGSKGSCQVGGNLSTNAGGVRVIRYGHARNWVQSVQVVLMSGEVLELSGDLEKNNTGYDLRHLLIGSEGTLAVITEATLKLTPKFTEKDTLFFACESMPHVLRLLRSARERGLPLLAFECFTRACLESVCAHRRLSEPLAAQTSFYALLDVERTQAASGLEAWLEELFAQGIVCDGTLAQGPADARRLWEFREGITESLAARGLVYKNDLALPVARLGDFTSELLAGSPRWYGPDCQLFFFGHIGDGNLHVNVLKPADMAADAFLKLCEDVNDPLFDCVRRHGGSIAAEHGIGLLKKRFLHYNRTPTEIELFRSIKRAFDPKGLLNPGKIFD